jgi:hypothetical protein
MRQSVIWYVSNSEPFPVTVRKHPRVDIKIKKLKPEGCANLELSSQEINIFYIKLNKKSWDGFVKQFKKEFELSPNVAYILLDIKGGGEELSKAYSKKSKYIVLDQPLQKNQTRSLIDKVIQLEHYKNTCLEIASSSLENYGMFEGVFTLAQKELKETKTVNNAIQSLLQFEDQIKKSQATVQNALTTIDDFRSAELMELHNRIKASENLEKLREKELIEAKKVNQAMEQALQFSRMEEMSMNKLINAQDKLFEYSEKEFRDLVEENKRLKKQLGIKE